jgi:hypothetical protein
MTVVLLACDVDATVTDGVVHVRFTYDTTSIGEPHLAYELRFPVEDGSPGWAEARREMQSDGTVLLRVTPPHSPVSGPHALRLMVTASWGANQTILWSER